MRPGLLGIHMTIGLKGLLLALALLGTGAVVGIACDRWMQASRPIRAELLVDTNDAVADALTELRKAVAAIPAELDKQMHAEPSLVSERRPVQAPDSGVVGLTRAVDRLEELLARHALQGSGVRPFGQSRSEPWKGPGLASLDVMRAKLQAHQRRASDAWEDEARQEFTRAHLLWTRDDVLERYGAPGHVAAAEVIGLVYDQVSFVLGEDNCWFEFITSQGIVTEVLWNCR